MEIKECLFNTGTDILLYLYTKKKVVILKDICQDVNLGPNAVYNYLDIFIKKKIVQTTKKGRVRFVNLTDKGIKLAKKLKNIMEMI